ncbi:MAG: class I SAM-dependent methyltransferase [Zoogloeaceae bacterium]|nr:class I SAM-dependent methyltransferase [Zoogloeaceae bacterium]
MSIPGLEAWQHTPQGRYVLDWETARLDVAVADVFGFNALQIGLPERDFLRANRMPLRQTLNDAPDASGGVACAFTHLPIAAQSVDLVVLPHVLEFYPEPHQILREVERILRPEARLFILGFNPLSLWGMKRRLTSAAARQQQGFPWNAHYLSVARIKDWLKLLGFEVDRGAFGIYAPPCKSEQWLLKRWRFMELAGNRWWGFAGSVYMLRAVKRVAGMHLILPAWDRRSLAGKALIKPVAHKTREDSQHE